MSSSKEEFVPPCDGCGAQCCKYIAMEIDRPRTKSDYDYIRWYLTHRDVNVFIDHDKKWHVEFHSPCDYLDKDGSCTIYSKRPKICREHGMTEGECEYYDSPYSLYISTLKEFEDYLDKRGVDWRFKKQ